jgi:ATP-dependent DNA helicase RecG
VKGDGVTDPAEGLRKVLGLERSRKFADTAVVGGLDRYLLRFAQDHELPPSHRFSQVLQSLPPGGYRALHPVQRQRVVEELLALAPEIGNRKSEIGGQSEGEVASDRERGRVLEFPRERPGAEIGDRKSESGDRDGSPHPPAPFERPQDRPSPGRGEATDGDGDAPEGAGLRARTAATPAPAVIGRLDSPVTVFKGVSKVTAGRLKRLRVETVEDFLFHFPVRYEDYPPAQPISRLRPGTYQTIIGEVFSAGESVVGQRKRVGEAIVSDGSGSIRLLWWSGPWKAKQLREGMRVAFSGKITAYRNRLQMENPEEGDPRDPALRSRRVVPVYRSTDRLDQRTILALKRQAVESFAHKLPERLPEGLRERLHLPPAPEAMRAVHLPDSAASAEAGSRRFAFEELLAVELGVVKRRREWQTSGAAPELGMPEAVREGFVGSLPFGLTGAQRKAIDTILGEIAGSIPMTRLLEGDVGSGKTVVAATALLAAVANGTQGAIMAPTEILAEQHFKTFARLMGAEIGDRKAENGDGATENGKRKTEDGDEPLGAGAPSHRSGEEIEGIWFQETGPGYITLRPPYLDGPISVALLRGSLRAGEKAAVRDSIARGEVDIAVGTHALIQGDVEFQKLGLVVVDEQHRFGVEQRAALREKGGTPHVLVMTATPIPRTLALTVYGDLDITVLDEVPPGRPETKTYRVPPRQRESAYKFVRTKVAEGRQAYVICPLVEESETIETKAAVQEYERLSRDVFPDLRLGLLHGRMSPAEKDATMRAFRDHELDVLVSTAVVEVGIDVPNATVILIEGADRFGLTQLHQFRGRVRRGELQSYCLLLFDTPSEEGEKRLEIMETTTDGFKLAEADLEMRGPGEYFGTRQSGLPDLRVAKLTDTKLIALAKDEAEGILDEDPELERPEHAGLREQVRKLWDRLTSEVS